MPETITSPSQTRQEHVSHLIFDVAHAGTLVVTAALGSDTGEAKNGLDFNNLHEGVFEPPEQGEHVSVDRLSETIAAAAVSGWARVAKMSDKKQKRYIMHIADNLSVNLQSFRELNEDVVDPGGLIEAIHNSIHWAINKGRFSPDPRKWRRGTTYDIKVNQKKQE